MMRRNAYLVPTLGLLLMSECCGFILQLKNNEHNKRSVFRQMVDAEPKDERQANHGAVTTGINIQAQSNSHHRQESTGFPTFVEEEYEQYSRSLSPREERNKLLAELESESKMGQETKFPLLKKWLHYSTRFIQKTTSLSKKKVPGKLIMIRCGESTSSAAGLFTGWLDPDLTDHGVQECVHAAQVLLGEGFDQFDVVYTSRLQRAIKSAWIILEQLNVLYIPVYKTYRLNPRMFGALQGLSKEETMKRLGINAVQAWQQSLKAKPPPCDDNQIEHPKYDARYRDLQVEEIPSSESLLDCQRRANPLWEYKIKRDLQNGKTVLVVAHRGTLHGLIKSIDQIDHNEYQDIRIPHCMPFVYRFDENMNPMRVTDNDEKQNSSQQPALDIQHLHSVSSASFLQDHRLVTTAMQEQHDRHKNMYLKFEYSGKEKMRTVKRTSSLKQSLSQLRWDHNLSSSMPLHFHDVSNRENVGIGVNGISINDYDEGFDDAMESHSFGEGKWEDDPNEFEEHDEFSLYDHGDATNFDGIAPTVNVLSLSKTSILDKSTDDSSIESASQNRTLLSPPKQNDPLVVLIRHGRTPHNNLGLFTGWEDPPLADGGVDDARNAGRILKRHGFQFDVVYTSWLTRAIQTAYYVLDELDSSWVPIVKSWRLNERMYGALTGKSKKMIANEYGSDQLKKWRRGYTIRPPPISSYSPNYPGNDMKRTKHFTDLPYSIRETISRSIEQRKFVLHRKFPKTESLQDCMSRSIPFYTKRIRADAIDKGKRVLITSHENAIRGILMHLCDIPAEAMNQLHLPNGLPLVYNVKAKCITLLDDGRGLDPLSVHDFGPAAKYLFKPCELPDEFFDSSNAS